MKQRGILIAIDSMGIDPLGHRRPESVYAQSRFLFPQRTTGDLLDLPDAPVEGALVETDVAGENARGAIECAITYTSIFSGKSALQQHGLLQGLGFKDAVLEGLIAQGNLFSLFAKPSLLNAVFPFHPEPLGASYVEDLLPRVSRAEMEANVRFRNEPLRLTGPGKHGFAELFTLAEINQNIFVYAARQAGVRLRTVADVVAGYSLTSSMTNELETDFQFPAHFPRLPKRTPEEAAQILLRVADESDFVFYKYQLPDLISHTGQLAMARTVFDHTERFVGRVLTGISRDTFVLVTSDHGHLEQMEFHRGHPKSKVPTWCFGPGARTHAEKLRRPEAIFHFFREQVAGKRTAGIPA